MAIFILGTSTAAGAAACPKAIDPPNNTHPTINPMVCLILTTFSLFEI